MTSIHTNRTLSVLALACAILALAGCSDKKDSANSFSAEQDHIGKAARFARQYTAATGKVPADIEQVEKWAKKNKKKGLEGDTFKSTRDGQPYQVKVAPMGVMVFEQTGVAGKVYVALPQGAPGERDLSQIKNMTESMERGMEKYENK